MTKRRSSSCLETQHLNPNVKYSVILFHRPAFFLLVFVEKVFICVAPSKNCIDCMSVLDCETNLCSTQ